MRRLLLLSALAAALFGADSQFNGRWDIRVLNEPKARAWWMEVTGAGTSALAGRFIGFPGGDINDIQNMSIRNGELRFTFDAPARNNSPAVHQEYAVRLVGEKLEGTTKTNRGELKWVGVRAPEITDRDDDSWKKGKPVELFSQKHRDLRGWHGIVPGQDLGWSVKDGLLTSTGGANNLESDQKFWNFLLHVEYNVAPHSNSGIGLRGRYEVQILEDRGRPLDRHSSGALYSRIVPNENVSKAAGEWQTFDIRLVGRHVTIVSNGKQIVKGDIDGLTAMATDADEGKPGPITLQGDHGPVQFRSIVLTPLTKD